MTGLKKKNRDPRKKKKSDWAGLHCNMLKNKNLQQKKLSFKSFVL